MAFHINQKLILFDALALSGLESYIILAQTKYQRVKSTHLLTKSLQFPVLNTGIYNTSSQKVFLYTCCTKNPATFFFTMFAFAHFLFCPCLSLSFPYRVFIVHSFALSALLSSRPLFTEHTTFAHITFHLRTSIIQRSV